MSYKIASYKKFIVFSWACAIALGVYVLLFDRVLQLGLSTPEIIGHLPMAVDSAICFMLLGLCLVFTFHSRRPVLLLFAKVVCLVIISCGILALLYNFDFILFKTVHFGMVPQTAFCFICTGIAIFNINSRSPILLHAVQILFNLVTIMTFVVLVGHAYDVKYLHHLSFSSMSIYAAVCFFIFTIAAALVNPSVGIIDIFTGRRVGNVVARKIFFQILVAVLLLGYLHVLDHRYNCFSDEFGSSLQTVMLIIMGMAMAWETSASLNKIDHKERIARENFRVAVESAPYALVLSDKTGTIILVNHLTEKLYGYSREELVGQPVKLIIPPTVHDDYERRRDSFFEKNMVLKMGVNEEEMLAIRRDGTVFPIEITMTPVKTESESILLASVVDISKRKLNESIIRNQLAELQSKNQELEQFNYISSHDLQEPLRTVMNYIELLKEDYPEFNNEVHEHLNTMQAAVGRMSMVIKSLLDFGRIGRKKKLVLTNCEKIINEVITDLSSLIKNCGATITVDCKIPDVYAYETELRQLFQNLIANAVKFRKEDVAPKISVCCTEHTEYYEFSVSDNGIGIAPKYFDKIFNIFQRLNKDEDYEGHGIGLANCKKIVEMHGGCIWVESAPDEGSTFKFTILKFKP